MKYRPDSDEEACCAEIDHGHYQVVCMRIKGHEGGCVPLASEAAKADGKYHCCWLPLGGAHHPKCLQP